MAAARKKGDVDAFQRWVAAYGGAEKVASRLGVHIGTVQCWLYRQGWPKVAKIVQLIELSKGELTFEDIIASTAAPGQQAPAKRKKGA